MSVFSKINLKGQEEILVLNAPPSFEPELAALDGVTIHRDPTEGGPVGFALAFVVTQDGLDEATSGVLQRVEGDATVWFAYPKASSRRYRCEFNRDSGWEALGRAGYEGVRQVAIDEDWSAIRFRRVEHIRRMSRDASRALSEAGRARTGGA